METSLVCFNLPRRRGLPIALPWGWTQPNPSVPAVRSQSEPQLSSYLITEPALGPIVHHETIFNKNKLSAFVGYFNYCSRYAFLSVTATGDI